MTTETFDQQGSLMSAVVGRLAEMKDTEYMGIWKETKIPYYWVRKIAKGEIKNPSVNRMQFLYEYLTKKQLVV